MREMVSQELMLLSSHGKNMINMFRFFFTFFETFPETLGKRDTQKKLEKREQ